MGSFGSSATTQSTNTGNTTGTFTPTQNQQVTDFRNSLYPQISSLLANAAKPAYGQAEEAQFTNKLNQNTDANINQLTNQLASRTGSVNSGAYATGLQNLLNQRGQAQAGYAQSVPLLNQNAYFSRLGAGLGLGNSIAGPALTSNTQSGTTNGSSTETKTYNPSIMSDIGGFASIAGSIAGIPGIGNIFGGNNINTQALNNQTLNNASQNMTGAGGYGMGNFSDIGYGPNGMPVGGGFNDIPGYF